jgi:hypothetical protein
MNEIDAIDSIESLIDYIEKAGNKYDDLYNFTGTISKAIGSLSTMVDEGFDKIINNSPKEIEDEIKEGLKDKWYYRFIKDLSLASLIDYSPTVKNLVNQLLAGVKTNIIAALESLQDEVNTGNGIVGVLEDLTADSNSLTSKILSYLFEQESSLDYIKNLLKETISAIEDLELDRITGENTDLKKAAIIAARNNAIPRAVEAAKDAVKTAFENKNTEELNKLSSSAWGIFQLLINSEDVANFCAKNNLMEIYNALVELDNIVKDMVTYGQEGAIILNPAKAADYVENVDYWVEALTESNN